MQNNGLTMRTRRVLRLIRQVHLCLEKNAASMAWNGLCKPRTIMFNSLFTKISKFAFGVIEMSCTLLPCHAWLISVPRTKSESPTRAALSRSAPREAFIFHWTRQCVAPEKSIHGLRRLAGFSTAWRHTILQTLLMALCSQKSPPRDLELWNRTWFAVAAELAEGKETREHSPKDRAYYISWFPGS